MNTKLGSALVLLSASLLAACGGDDGADDDGDAMEIVLPSGSKCESGSTLTYDNFAKGFFDEYCTRCHSSQRTGADRNGAPSGVDFDSLAAIKAVSAPTVDRKAVYTSTPGGTPEMPINDPRPDAATRAELGVWLACGMH